MDGAFERYRTVMISCSVAQGLHLVGVTGIVTRIVQGLIQVAVCFGHLDDLALLDSLMAEPDPVAGRACHRIPDRQPGFILVPSQALGRGKLDVTQLLQGTGCLVVTGGGD